MNISLSSKTASLRPQSPKRFQATENQRRVGHTRQANGDSSPRFGAEGKDEALQPSSPKFRNLIAQAVDISPEQVLDWLRTKSGKGPSPKTPKSEDTPNREKMSQVDSGAYSGYSSPTYSNCGGRVEWVDPTAEYDPDDYESLQEFATERYPGAVPALPSTRYHYLDDVHESDGDIEQRYYW